MDVKKILIQGLVAGVAMLIANLVWGQLTNWVFPSLAAEYANTALFRPWSDPLMMYIYVHPFLMGIIIAKIWYLVKGLFKKKTEKLKNGAKLGVFFWVVSSIPGMLMTISSFQVSTIMVLSWTISNLIQLPLAGAVVAQLDKK